MEEKGALKASAGAFETRAIYEAFQNYYYEWYLKRVSPFMLLFGGVLCILSALYLAIGVDFGAHGRPAMFLALIDGLAGLLLLLVYLYLRSLVSEFRRIGRRTSADFFASGLIVVYSIIIGTAPQMPVRSAIFVFGVMSLLLVPRLKPLRLLATGLVCAVAFVMVDIAMQAEKAQVVYSAIEAFAAVLLAYALSAMSYANRIEAFTWNYKLNLTNSALKAETELDPLTGLVSRRRSNSMFNHEWFRAKRYKTVLSALMIDIDGLKRANEEGGTAAGDELILAVAEALRAAVKRGSDILTRCASDEASGLGGDEFIVLLPDTAIEGARVVLGNILSLINERNYALDSAQAARKLSVSIGAASAAPAEEGSIDELFMKAKADMLESRAKKKS